MFSNSVLRNLGTPFTADPFRLFFLEEHMELPKNAGEKRESLIILEKVGLYEGLLASLSTDQLVSFS
jgi:hypothetical protein